MKYILMFIFVFQTTYANDSSNSSKSGPLKPLIYGLAVVASPVFPPAFLLARPASIQNRKNARKGGLSLSGQLVQANGKTSLGINAEYALTKDLNYWLVKASQYSYLASDESDVKVQKIGLEYRMIPYKGFRMGLGFGLGKWTTETLGESVSENSAEFSFPVEWQATKALRLYYQPNYTYFSKSKDSSGELSAGLVFKLLNQIRLRAGVIHLFGRDSKEDETLTSLDFALSL